MTNERTTTDALPSAAQSTGPFACLRCLDLVSDGVDLLCEQCVHEQGMRRAARQYDGAAMVQL